MTKIVQKTAAIQSLQTGELTKEQVYRLWKCAIKDDDRLADALIQKIYDGMSAEHGSLVYMADQYSSRSIAILP